MADEYNERGLSTPTKASMIDVVNMTDQVFKPGSDGTIRGLEQMRDKGKNRSDDADDQRYTVAEDDKSYLLVSGEGSEDPQIFSSAPSSAAAGERLVRESTGSGPSRTKASSAFSTSTKSPHSTVSSQELLDFQASIEARLEGMQQVTSDQLEELQNRLVAVLTEQFSKEFKKLKVANDQKIQVLEKKNQELTEEVLKLRTHVEEVETGVLSDVSEERKMIHSEQIQVVEAAGAIKDILGNLKKAAVDVEASDLPDEEADAHLMAVVTESEKTLDTVLNPIQAGIENVKGKISTITPAKPPPIQQKSAQSLAPSAATNKPKPRRI